MRRMVSLAVTAFCLVATPLVTAADYGCAAPDCAAPVCSAPACGCDGAADPCCGVRGCLLARRLACHGPRYEGLEPGFNCGCNGSYKFPVPPLYTYHWPGMYSAQLMTDYHSPWRFPPLKPYSDELPPVETTASRSAAGSVRPVSLELPTATRPAGVMEPLSSKLLR